MNQQSTNHSRKTNSIFYLIILGYTLYAILFIVKTSLVVDGVRYFTLFDDAMISMRYAKNLVNGYGLVWNPGGERVEGYTNFLWTIYMAFWHLFPVSTAKISLPIQLSGLMFLICSLFLIRRIADYVSGENKYVVIGAVLLTASYQPINYWGLKGMETSVLGVIVLLSVWRVFKCLKKNIFDPFLFVILGTGLLVRPDTVFLFVGITLFVIIVLPEYRKKNALFALSIFFLTQAALTLFRLVYYNDILPNTYYLKMTGVPLMLRIRRGAIVASDFIDGMSYFLFALPFVYCILRIKNKKIWFLLYLFLIQLFYSIYVGGDAWEWWGHLANRYICFVMPLFFILISLVISSFIKEFASYSGIPDGLKKGCFIVLVVLTVIQLHSGFGKTVFRNLTDFPLFQREEDKDNVGMGLKLKEITTPNAKIAVGWAGAPPYFSDRYCIDLLGKNDAFLAHQKTRAMTVEQFDPGHHKYNWSYSIGELKPDIVLDYDERWYAEKEIQYFRKNYRILKIKKDVITLNTEWWIIYCRQNSPNIDWSKGSIINWDEGFVAKFF